MVFRHREKGYGVWLDEEIINLSSDFKIFAFVVPERSQDAQIFKEHGIELIGVMCKQAEPISQLREFLKNASSNPIILGSLQSDCTGIEC